MNAAQATSNEPTHVSIVTSVSFHLNGSRLKLSISKEVK
jgi:hypothetical protein